MKSKILQVRMTEEELQELKEFTESMGLKSSSEAVREGLKIFINMNERCLKGQDAIDATKISNSSNILVASRGLCDWFELEKYLVGEIEQSKIPSKYQNMDYCNTLIAMYDNGEFNNIKFSVLSSIHNDIMLGIDISKENKELIEKIIVDYLKYNFEKGKR